MTHIVMVDDARADGWAPLALTRPCGELRFGRWTLRERIERAAGGEVKGHLSRPWLARFTEPGAPPVLASAEPDQPVLYWNARAAADAGARIEAGPANVWIDGALAGVRTDDGARAHAALIAGEAVSDLPDLELDGAWLQDPWDLIASGPSRLAADLAETTAGAEASIPEGCWKIGDHPVVLGRDVRVEPGVLFDTRDGPIELDADVEVGTGARLAGPVYAGPRSRLLGGAIAGFSGGPYCYVRGEIEEATWLGYSNKAHDGFLGHAYLGRWVNLGAMTTNSDLKNNYGTIRVGPPDAQIDTGLIKLGCILGDHVKTGIGVLLNTGTLVGAGSNLFGSTMPPKWVPPFAWGEGEDLTTYRKDRFVDTASTVATRRGTEADATFRGWLEDVWDEACGE